MKNLTFTWKMMLGGVAIVLITLLSVGVVATLEISSHLEAGSRTLVEKTAQDIAELVQLALKQEINMAVEIAGAIVP